MLRFFNTDYARMAQFFIAAVVCYTIAYFMPVPQVQTAFWKVGHVALGAHAGYWIGRCAYQKLRPRVLALEQGSTSLTHLDIHVATGVLRNRAIITAAAMLAMAFGL